MENDETNNLFYSKAKEYWANVDPTVDGVLGGFGWISSADIEGSNQFLMKLLKDENGPDTQRALDCGAGVGRITQDLLLKNFTFVDLVEQDANFISEAKKQLSSNSNCEHFYECGLQEFTPSENYDVIWCQWVLSHLTDSDLVDFLRRCSSALRPKGLIIIKENISSSKKEIMDQDDSSVTRPLSGFLKIFRAASLRVVRQAQQKNFPRASFPFWFWHGIRISMCIVILFSASSWNYCWQKICLIIMDNIKVQLVIAVILTQALFPEIHKVYARPGTIYDSPVTAKPAGCATMGEIDELCQKCAKHTKSTIVYPLCCGNKEESREFCQKYLDFGLQ